MKYSLWVAVLMLAMLLGSEAASLSKVSTRLLRQGTFLSKRADTSSEKSGFRTYTARSGRHSFEYLVAVQQWKHAAARGLRCPPPAPCSCHCDCPDTLAEQPPPPAEPCPIHFGFPTTPMPEMVVTTTLGPTMGPNSVRVPGFNKPLEFSSKCKVGEVFYSDGKCKKVTVKMIETLIQLCNGLKERLDETEKQANSSPPQEYVYMKFNLMTANDRYRRALDLLLGLLNNFASKDDSADDAAEEDEKENFTLKEEEVVEGKGPEFLRGRRVHRVHCEPWTKNATTYVKNLKSASPNQCGVLCRNQPTCVGFAVDPGYGWCIWYDDKVEPPFLDQQCSSQNYTEYTKNWEGPYNETLWVTMEKVHAYERKWNYLLRLAEVQAEFANKSFYSFWAESNDTKKKGEMEMLMEAKKNYTTTMTEAELIKSYYIGESEYAYQILEEQVVEYPPFPDAAASLPEPGEAGAEAKGPAKPIQAIAEDLKPSPTPIPMSWEDFPNSGDTPWSQQHPECPMGPACWCDCQCRGAPPQNFIANPPPPPKPCPPPPLPPPPFANTPVFAR